MIKNYIIIIIMANILIIQQAGFILKRMFLHCETPCTTCTAGEAGREGGGNPNGFMPNGKK